MRLHAKVAIVKIIGELPMIHSICGTLHTILIKSVTIFKKSFVNLSVKEMMEKCKSELTGLASVKGGRGLINTLLKIVRLIQAKAPTKSDVKVVKYFSKKIFHLVTHSGMGHTIKYLKTCGVMLQQFVAKDTTGASSRSIGKVAVACSRSGLPTIIPAQQRLLIRRGDVNAIKL
jgi:hypothetical protein